MLSPDQQKLSDNQNIPAGQTGSPWTAPTPKVPSINPNNTGGAFQANYNAGLVSEGSGVDASGNPLAGPNGNPKTPGIGTGPVLSYNPTATGNGTGTNGQPVSSTNPPAPKTEGELYSDALNNSQGLIDSINKSTRAQLDEQGIANEQAAKEAEYNAAAGNMMGTPGAGAGIEDAGKKGAAANQVITTNGAQQIQTVLKSIADNAQSTALDQTQQNFTNQGTAETNKATVQANEQNAQASLKQLASIPGFNYSAFKNSPYYQQLVQQSGMDGDTMDMYFNSLLPIAQQIQWQPPVTDTNGNTLLYGLNPMTNQIETKQLTGGAPAGSSLVMKDSLPFYQTTKPDGTPDPNGVLVPAPLTGSEKNAATEAYQFYVGQALNSGTPPDQILNAANYAILQKTATSVTTQNGTPPSVPGGGTIPTTSSASNFAPGSSAAVGNPLGLKPGGQFSQFLNPDGSPNMQAGFQAGAQQIQNYQTKNPNMTIDDFVSTWITGKPGATGTGYTGADVAKDLGVTGKTTIGQLDNNALATSVANHESPGWNTAGIPTIASGATPDQIQAALTSGPKVAGYDQGTLYNAAIQDMLGIPLTVVGGMGSASARKALGNKETDIMTAYGISPTDVATAKAEYSALDASNAKLVNTAAYIKTYTGTATDNLNLALAQSANVPRTGAKLPNKWLQWFQGSYTPAGPLSKFETYIYTAAREYAKVTSGGATSGAGLTDSAQAEADKLLNASQSPEAFQQVVQAMQQDMANVNGNFDSQLSNFAPSIAGLLGAATNGGSSNGSNNSGGDYQTYLQAIGGQ